MDPNETLKLLRELATDINIHGFNHRYVDPVESAHQLSALFANLDTWIINGGFLPSDWNTPSYSGQADEIR